MSADYEILGPVPDGMDPERYAPVYQFKLPGEPIRPTPILGQYAETNVVNDDSQRGSNVLRFPRVIDLDVRFPDDDVPLAA